jgi:LysM repeat protein
MGQLEKYGLYVLCLVIFLILGVTIWGDPDSSTRQQQSGGVPMRVNSAGMPLGDGNGIPVARTPQTIASGSVLSSLLKPIGRRVSTPKVQPKVQPKDQPKAAGNNPMITPAVKPVVKSAVKPVVAASTRKYTVKNGDIIGRIAQKQLGSTRYVKAIRDLNPALRSSDKLDIGQVLVLPASGKVKVAAGSADFRTYTISKGDNFEDIAARELNELSRWREIQDLNPNVNPHRLIPGKKIKLPLN